MVSRFHILEETADYVVVRCAMTLNELRHGHLISYPADLEYRLKPTADGFVIDRKIVRLMHSDGFLRTVSFIF